MRVIARENGNWRRIRGESGVGWCEGGAKLKTGTADPFVALVAMNDDEKVVHIQRIMKPYQNLSGDAGVVAYDYGPKWIHVRFSESDTYEYTSGSVGSGNLKEMKRLADAGEGLTTFINQHPLVKMGYTRRLE